MPPPDYSKLNFINFYNTISIGFAPYAIYVALSGFVFNLSPNSSPTLPQIFPNPAYKKGTLVTTASSSLLPTTILIFVPGSAYFIFT